MNASEFLELAAEHILARAKTYDQPDGERSIARTVDAFNAITGSEMTTSEGWLFMMLLKVVRDRQNGPHEDSLQDLVAYAALYGEERTR